MSPKSTNPKLCGLHVESFQGRSLRNGAVGVATAAQHVHVLSIVLHNISQFENKLCKYANGQQRIA